MDGVGRGECTVAYYTDLLVTQVVAPVPACRVHELSLEVFQTLDIRIARLVQLAHG
jgi:hypothetical protein